MDRMAEWPHVSREYVIWRNGRGIVAAAYNLGRLPTPEEYAEEISYLKAHDPGDDDDLRAHLRARLEIA